jgi:hypothetical protein
MESGKPMAASQTAPTTAIQQMIQTQIDNMQNLGQIEAGSPQDLANKAFEAFAQANFKDT